MSRAKLSKVTITALLGCVGFIDAATGAEVETEMAVSCSDYNRASSLLYQWWGLFEGPDGNDVSNYFDTVFSENVQLTFGELKINGIEQLRDVYASLPTGIASAHHIESIAVTKSEENDYELVAHFLYQSSGQGVELSSSRRRYNHSLDKTPDGNFVLRVVRATTLKVLNEPDFRSSYLANRARAAITQYLGIIDVLGGDYAELSSLMDGDSEIHEVIKTSDERFNNRRDGVLRGTAEISNWLQSRTATFTQVAHRLEELALRSTEADTIEVRIKVKTRAWPHRGDLIDVESSFDLTLRETGQRFMLIESIRRATG